MEVAAAGEALLPPPSSCSPSGEFEALPTEFNPLLQNAFGGLKLHTLIILKFLWHGVAGLPLEVFHGAAAKTLA